MNICYLIIFTAVFKDRDLWVVKLTTATELLGVPNIKIVGNIHGNEPVGKEIILHMIQVSHKITTYTRNTYIKHKYKKHKAQCLNMYQVLYICLRVYYSYTYICI